MRTFRVNIKCILNRDRENTLIGDKACKNCKNFIEISKKGTLLKCKFVYKDKIVDTIQKRKFEVKDNCSLTPCPDLKTCCIGSYNCFLCEYNYVMSERDRYVICTFPNKELDARDYRNNRPN